ncbi:AMP-dependent synthetase/ligase [Caldifermentibacillus hisashii]|uniref:AMP-dependent synthetase/ligase n=1 Tax=Caldifermentibacillus hisashii TaxID=996558 RepID=UPI000BA33C34|nr:long-chain fatty acid--CoA ligase [Caldifermentibacillus hisashii]PAC37748.1 long-chain fatty acid--CoA ligase [Caldifermentibacillus hisashii]
MKPENLVEMLDRTIDKYPNKTAFIWKEDGIYQKMTYRTFWQKIIHVASGLHHLGIQEQDKVAIISNSNPMWGITDFALASLNAVSVPIYPTLPTHQVRYILENADVRAVVVENEIQRKKIIDSRLETIDYIITMYPNDDYRSTDNEISFAQLEEIGKRNSLNDWEERWRNIDRDQLVTIIHTSGTSGKPNGVMLTHGNFLANIEAVQFWLIEITPDDLALSYLPLSHVFERMAGHYTLLSVGATIAYAESIDTLPENLKEIQPTVMTSVPRFFEKVYARVMEEIEQGSAIKKKVFNWAVNVGIERYELYLKARVDELILGDTMPKSLKRKWKIADRLVFQKVKKQLGGNLRGLVSGGGSLNRDIANFFWAIDLPILEGYGLSETAPVVATNPMVRAKIGTVGKVLPNLEVKMADDGELFVRGPSVMKGYYKNEEATKEAFDGDWFKTGDLGEWDEDGYLKIVDRKKRILVLSTGKNVAPQSIENAICESAFIEYALVVGDKRKFVVALIKPDYEQLIPWMERHGIQGKFYNEIVRDEKVQHLLISEVEQAIQQFAEYEKPKRIIIVEDEWTVESGEITPKLSVRYKVVENKYRDAIEKAYDEEDKDKKNVKVLPLNGMKNMAMEVKG